MDRHLRAVFLALDLNLLLTSVLELHLAANELRDIVVVLLLKLIVVRSKVGIHPLRLLVVELLEAFVHSPLLQLLV